MTNEDQLSRKKVFECNQLLVLTDDRVRALLPGQPYIRAKTFLKSGAFVASLHDAPARARNDHESGIRNFLPELRRLLILLLAGLHPSRPENRHFPRLRIRRKQPERIAQLPQRRLDDL